MGNKFLIEELKSGFNGTFRVIPITLSSGVRVELPEELLDKRKCIYVYNTGETGQYLFVGDISVDTEITTTSGLPIDGSCGFEIPVGRGSVYGISNYPINIKVVEYS